MNSPSHDQFHSSPEEEKEATTRTLEKSLEIEIPKGLIIT